MGLYDPLLKQSGQVPQVSAMKFTVDQPGGPEVHAWVRLPRFLQSLLEY